MIKAKEKAENQTHISSVSKSMMVLLSLILLPSYAYFAYGGYDNDKDEKNFYIDLIITQDGKGGYMPNGVVTPKTAKIDLRYISHIEFNLWELNPGKGITKVKEVKHKIQIEFNEARPDDPVCGASMDWPYSDKSYEMANMDLKIKLVPFPFNFD